MTISREILRVERTNFTRIMPRAHTTDLLCWQMLTCQQKCWHLCSDHGEIGILIVIPWRARFNLCRDSLKRLVFSHFVPLLPANPYRYLFCSPLTNLAKYLPLKHILYTMANNPKGIKPSDDWTAMLEEILKKKS